MDEDALHAVIPQLRPADFSAEAHRFIYAAMLDLFQNHQPVDWATLTAELKRNGRLEAAGGVPFLTDLADAVPTTANIQHYVRMVQDKATLRRLLAASSEIAERCYSDPQDVTGLLDEAEQAVFAIGESRVSAGFRRIQDLLPAAWQTVETLYERKEGITGVPSGFADLDSLTAGFQTSDLIIIAGRPSMGKTSLGLDVALHAARSGTPAGVFSLEMSNEQLVLRMLCSMAHVNLKSVRTGFLSGADWSRLTTAIGALDDVPLFLDDTPAINTLEIRARARRLKREANLGLIVVDYLQLMRGHGESREQEIAEISRSLKALAKELDVPVIALSQLNRRCEERTDKRPQLADLRESGAIEQDADVILFIYRDEVYNKSPDNPKRGEAEVIVGKQRNGPIGMVRLAFAQEWSTFLPLSRRDDAAQMEGI